MYEAVVVGSGPAGLNAALYLKRAGKHVIVIEKEYEGAGQITRSTCVENYLGIPAVSGEELGERLSAACVVREYPVSEQVDITAPEAVRSTIRSCWMV